jgi:hypothetical protein
MGDADGGAASADDDVTPAAAERGRERSSSSGPLGRLLVPRPESDLAENTLMADLAATCTQHRSKIMVSINCRIHVSVIVTVYHKIHIYLEYHGVSLCRN